MLLTAFLQLMHPLGTTIFTKIFLLRPSVLHLNINVCGKHINITLNIWFCKKIINTSSLFDLHVTAKKK